MTGSKHAPDRHRWRCSHVDVPVWRLSQIGSVTHLGGSAVRMPGDHALALEVLSLWSLALARTIHGRPVDHARRVGGDESGRVSQSFPSSIRSEEHTSELQSLAYLVCRLLLEKKKT